MKAGGQKCGLSLINARHLGTGGDARDGTRLAGLTHRRFDEED